MTESPITFVESWDFLPSLAFSECVTIYLNACLRLILQFVRTIPRQFIITIIVAIFAVIVNATIVATMVIAVSAHHHHRIKMRLQLSLLSW